MSHDTRNSFTDHTHTTVIVGKASSSGDATKAPIPYVSKKKPTDPHFVKGAG